MTSSKVTSRTSSRAARRAIWPSRTKTTSGKIPHSLQTSWKKFKKPDMKPYDGTKDLIELDLVLMELSRERDGMKCRSFSVSVTEKGACAHGIGS